MNSPKVDNQLNLALDATQEERDKSMDLNVGYDENDRQWDLIIKYSGPPEVFYPYVSAITPLLNQYAVVRIRQSRIEEFVKLPQVEYVEKPKRLFFSLYQAQAVSGINPVKEAPRNLTGAGVLVACVDSGIDYVHRDFCNQDGSTRLIALWDQTVEGSPPDGYFLGTEFTREQIDKNLFERTQDVERSVLQPSFDRADHGNQSDIISPLSVDYSGHGTAVMGIAAGNGRASDGVYEGVAPESDLLVVKLGNPLPDSFPRTSELIQAIDYCVRKAIDRNQPMVLNLSYGSSYGSREGNSLLETYLNQVASMGRQVICVGMGNEGKSAGHQEILFRAPGEIVDVELAVGAYQTGFSLQMWKNYTDELSLELISPTGVAEQLVSRSQETGSQKASRFFVGNTKLLFYYGLPSPYSLAQEWYLEFLPEKDAEYVDSGIWHLRFISQKIVDGTVDLYLPGGGTINEDTRFLTPTPERTLTIPAAASGVIAVGAYDARLNSYANFSGRGYTRETNQVKPDLAAPGVNILVPKSGSGNPTTDGYHMVTGTSFSTPFVSGAAALMMEWGIVRGNDPYLYGEAVKANLRRGARQLPGIRQWPNPELGYGVLDLASSIPDK